MVLWLSYAFEQPCVRDAAAPKCRWCWACDGGRFRHNRALQSVGFAGACTEHTNWSFNDFFYFCNSIMQGVALCLNIAD